ncbi:MAG: Beta-N-acetylhexosaminidase [Sphingobacteriaceae bacterium]|jgi:hexosaminidase|nr:Beta-N-acetylhexosaminidase [Sphingobacteriaceae bacterium]
MNIRKHISLLTSSTKLLPVICLLVTSLTLSAQETTSSTDVKIIPAPVKVTRLKGSLPISQAMAVSAQGFKAQPQSLLAFARNLIKVQANGSKAPAGKGLTFELSPSLPIPDEGYRLNINASGVKISSKTEKGIFYGLQSVGQLFEKGAGSQASLPYVSIEDYPRYAYRGVMLDVGRHFFPVSFIKQYIDLMSTYKFNNFHWHLTDDQGWRIEIKKYPKLTSVGAYRDQTVIGSNKEKVTIYDSIPYGGFYTQAQIRDVVAYAASKYINVIPEIEMPGHSVAALTAYPELACGDNPGPFKVRERWGVSEDVYCAGKEQTFTFLQNVMDEVLTLFPSKNIHIGGDECPKTRWKTCPYCQKRIKDQGLKDEHELQSYFVQRMEKYLNSKGRTIIGWDEIMEGGLAPNAIVMSWRGTKGGIASAMQNHQVIMSPNNSLYFDHKESASPEEPLTNVRLMTMKNAYMFNPTPAELDDAHKKYVVGVQGNVWTELMETPAKVQYMLLPRMLALSEISWTPNEDKNWNDFSENRLPRHLAVLGKQGVRFRVPEPIGLGDSTVTGGSRYTLNLKSPVEGASVYYTTNGRIPYDVDNLYTKPVTVFVPAGGERTIKAVTITPQGERSVVVTTVLKNPESK